MEEENKVILVEKNMQKADKHAIGWPLSLSIYILTLETSFSPVTSNTIVSGCLLYLNLQLWILPWATIYTFTCLYEILT